MSKIIAIWAPSLPHFQFILNTAASVPFEICWIISLCSNSCDGFYSFCVLAASYLSWLSASPQISSPTTLTLAQPFPTTVPLLPIVVLQVCSCGLKALAFSIPPSKRVLPHLSPPLLYSNVIFLSEDFPNTLYRNNTLSPQLSLSPFALFIFSVTFSTT